MLSPISELPACPPRPMPQYFRAAGLVRSAVFCKGNPLRNLKGRGTTAAQKAGKRYEKKAFEYLHKNYGSELLLHPWLSFENNQGGRFCQPDALIVKSLDVFIIEIKVRHTVDAYWQLAHLYSPVMQKLYPFHTIHLIEMTKSFDPDVLFPTPIKFSYEMDHFFKNPLGESAIGVCQWAG